MSDALDSNARCIACDSPVHTLCKDGAPRFVECHVSADGEFALIAGRLQELPAGAMAARGVMRFGDHARRCKGSLRPEPSDVPTRRTGVWNRGD